MAHKVNTHSPPLVVDLDGTLTPTDTLLESILLQIKASPFTLFLFPFWLLLGRAHFKRKIANNITLPAELLPYNQELLNYLKQQKRIGRKLILATAAHESIASKVSAHLKIFDQVLSTNLNVNLKGKNKLSAIRNAVGNDFSYAGDSPADLPIWESAKTAIFVNLKNKHKDQLSESVIIEREFHIPGPTLVAWIKAIRLHQWTKNILLFIPLLTSFSFIDAEKSASAIIGFLAFSLLASGTYIFNDLWDISSDRQHPTKNNRPFASAQLSIISGIILAATLVTAGIVTGSYLSSDFTLVLILYLALTSLYSFFIKESFLFDAFTLSILYTMRIIAGAVAIGVDTSPWLLTFSLFIFFSLALVKRCSELKSIQDTDREQIIGRSYCTKDLGAIFTLGVGTAISSVIIFGLFILSDNTQERYQSPHLLWLAVLGLCYWLSLIWIKTAHGEMNDDPLIFVFSNIRSLITIILIAAILIISHFSSIGDLV
ncbi:4-hydroxybenzoate polyprenyltransferase [Solemya pervernicosa gill symbiont]|uniref:4-hydroxybenzoate polyprenyltransferase n=3 Tax=Gammaproteobacteria incertae sedis TaxID=118884 RepID=A0A1T2L2U1_9GAMM|nr:4-hydroxybenzoate polyprenyltransferase [Solemya pervernicosa gill symbiont]QKQ28126.1 UbiA family prenyltransferase [Candidatus Reidiella endopervernicosa]